MYGELASGEESPGILSDDQPPESPCDSNDTDETGKNFPWMKIVSQTLTMFNYNCQHRQYCHPFCHRRQMRASGKLIQAVRQIYGEKFGYQPDTKKKDPDEETKKDSRRSRKVSDQLHSSPEARKDSMGATKKFKIDKSMDGLESEKIFTVHRDSSIDRNPHSSKDFIPEPPDEETESKFVEKEPCAMTKYLKNCVGEHAFHTTLAILIKGAVVVPDEIFVEILPFAWELLLEVNQEVVGAAAALFIIGAVRAPVQATEIMHKCLEHEITEVRINAILRFQILWKMRFQVWVRMEENAHMTFKVPPPGIEFTLPSPKIGIESLPVVDPPWLPQVKTKVEEVTINEQRHVSI